MNQSRRPPSETLNLPPELVSRCHKAGHYGVRRCLRENHVLYAQNTVSTRFFVLTKGRIKLSILREDGYELLLDIIGPGSLCGEAAAFDGEPRFSTAIVIDEAEVIELDRDQMPHIFAEDPQLGISLMKVFALKQRMLAFRLAQTTQNSTEARIVELLRQIGGTSSRLDFHPPWIDLTHEQIASLTSTSRVTVTRALGRLRQCGVVRVSERRIQLVEEELGTSLTPS